MSILAECPICHKKQATKNHKCSCGQNLVNAKRSNRIRYWIVYRINGKQRKEYASKSIEEARAAEGKRRGQKIEDPHILEKAIEEKNTFRELTSWYLELSSRKNLKSINRVKICLEHFNNVFGDTAISKIKLLDLEEYQCKREDVGIKPATIDQELTNVKTMINKAFDNDKVSGRTLKVFRSWKRKLRKGDNVRDRIFSVDEFTRLLDKASPHLKAILIVAYNTGMRKGELRALQWKHIDLKKEFIRLPADMTKEKRPKNIPINRNISDILKSIPRALHHDFVFTFKTEPITQPGGLRRSFKTACKKADIPYGRKEPDGVTYHDLRGTVKTNMLRAGVDKIYRDKILGHSLQGMDAKYMAPSEDDLKQAMNKFTDWLDRQQVGNGLKKLGNI